MQPVAAVRQSLGTALRLLRLSLVVVIPGVAVTVIRKRSMLICPDDVCTTAVSIDSTSLLRGATLALAVSGYR